MFGLKPHKLYKTMSESKRIIQFNSWFIDFQEYYGDCSSLDFRLWTKKNGTYTLKYSLQIPLSLHSFYIQYIYRHTGKCHPDLRSKFYIGKPIEKTWNKEEI